VPHTSGLRVDCLFHGSGFLCRPLLHPARKIDAWGNRPRRLRVTTAEFHQYIAGGVSWFTAGGQEATEFC